tara:strand:- start:176 stop:337 length:162 start_codon:yes stop_codon:yes gene_type:complete
MMTRLMRGKLVLAHSTITICINIGKRRHVSHILHRIALLSALTDTLGASLIEL